MLRFLRAAVCDLLGHDYSRRGYATFPKLSDTCRRCGRQRVEAFRDEPVANPAMRTPVSLLHEQTTPPRETLSAEPPPLAARPPPALPRAPVHLHDGTMIAADEWDALLAAGRVSMLPSGQLSIAKQRSEPPNA